MSLRGDQDGEPIARPGAVGGTAPGRASASVIGRQHHRSLLLQRRARRAEKPSMTEVPSSQRSNPGEERGCSAEDLGEDVAILAAVAAERGRASIVRSINGVTVRVTVEAA